MARRSKRVLDAAALLNSSFFGYEEALIPPAVALEIRSRSHVLDALVSSGMVSIKAPPEGAKRRVVKAAERLGELNKLSEADVEALALALEVKGVLVTDDFHVQNVARALGIEYEPVTEGIREERRYVRICRNCGRKYPPTYKGKRCPVCGGPLVYSSNSELPST